MEVLNYRQCLTVWTPVCSSLKNVWRTKRKKIRRIRVSKHLLRRSIRVRLNERERERKVEISSKWFRLVLARVRITLSDTIIRLEHLINNSDRGVALEIKVKKSVEFSSILFFLSNQNSFFRSDSNISIAKRRVSIWMSHQMEMD